MNNTKGNAYLVSTEMAGLSSQRSQHRTNTYTVMEKEMGHKGGQRYIVALVVGEKARLTTSNSE